MVASGNVYHLSECGVKLEIQPVHCMYRQNSSGCRSLLSELPAQANQTGILKYFIDFEIGSQILSSCGYSS